MQEELMRTYTVLSRLNASCREQVISQEELDEQDSNFEDLRKILIELGNILTKLESNDLKSVDETVETLLQLHLKFSDYIWHIDQVHELVKKMAGNYRDSY
ncbi:hypothetical protein ACTNDP_20315 [Paenibacillus barengoltzii]|jgi:hypothetical protein|uniref:hypothetical protein n=1 Tax=Paenibacillus TaxID=44249 RepID=UPI0028FD4013|nr:hypothetical protein [Paenibacillus sp. 3LSP]MDU0328932.1 hypothetical protein [Paenibacillus sp. 3LSP]